ncbi:hypothetical protein WN48_09945 [Eufriesea mexicana]|uniref:Uncharacterized protein n=1 Tax=Eufriesea mexicana TaxID=516756 RepID=A0A310SRU5_9HYME|nr:hypothetical protein WN48_09945 [Eufriesea mexicana]
MSAVLGSVGDPAGLLDPDVESILEEKNQLISRQYAEIERLQRELSEVIGERDALLCEVSKFKSKDGEEFNTKNWHPLVLVWPGQGSRGPRPGPNGKSSTGVAFNVLTVRVPEAFGRTRSKNACLDRVRRSPNGGIALV